MSIRYWRVILDFLRSIFGDFKSSLKKSSNAITVSSTLAQPKRKFSSYRNPFATGEATRIAPRELLVQTFEALEAWSREHGMPRDNFATPIEFGDALSNRFFTMESDLKETARAYSQLAYGEVSPASDTLDALERLWTSMSTQLASR